MKPNFVSKSSSALRRALVDLFFLVTSDENVNFFEEGIKIPKFGYVAIQDWISKGSNLVNLVLRKIENHLLGINMRTKGGLDVLWVETGFVEILTETLYGWQQVDHKIGFVKTLFSGVRRRMDIPEIGDCSNATTPHRGKDRFHNFKENLWGRIKAR